MMPFWLAALILCCWSGCSAPHDSDTIIGSFTTPPRVGRTWDIIRTEASKPENDSDRPLPLAAHWNTGLSNDGYSPQYQIGEIEGQASLLLPWFELPNGAMDVNDPYWIEYYEPAIREAARLQLPISFLSLQWERPLTIDDRFARLPKADNPNVILANDKIERRMSPFGGSATWRQLGSEITATPILRRLQELYPNPTKIFFISNNEHINCCALPWKDADKDIRFRDQFGNRSISNFEKIQITQDGFARLYRALQDGMRDGLVSKAWRDSAVFIGYDAFGPRHYARWTYWQDYALSRPGKISAAPDMWDGGSPPYYLFNWEQGASDDLVYGPQVEAMNWVFMLKEAHRLNPQFRLELSVWDGNEPEYGDGTEVDANGFGGFNIDKRKTYAKNGTPYSPDRYSGMVQFGMWLLRPRVVREFRSYLDTRTGSEAFFRSVINAVGRVHRELTLRQFWRFGKLVANKAHGHPYNTIPLPGYENEERWFGLDTSAGVVTEQNELTTPVSVFALALVMGDAPSRRWLVYAHAPDGVKRQVQVTIPDYQSITLPEIAVAGSFYTVDEATGAVRQLGEPPLPLFEPPHTVSSFEDSISHLPLLSPGNATTVKGDNLQTTERISFDVVSSFGAFGTQRTIDCTNAGSATDTSCRILSADSEQLDFVLPDLQVNGVATLPVTLGLNFRAWHGSQLLASGWIPLVSAAPGVVAIQGEQEKIVMGAAIHRDPANLSGDILEPVYEKKNGGYAPRLITKQKTKLLLNIQVSGWRKPTQYRARREDEPLVNFCSSSAGRKRILIDSFEVPILSETAENEIVRVLVDATAVVDLLGEPEKNVALVAKMFDCWGVEQASNTAYLLLGRPARTLPESGRQPIVRLGRPIAEPDLSTPPASP